MPVPVILETEFGAVPAAGLRHLPCDWAPGRQPMVRVLIADNDPDALDLAVLDLRLEGHTVLGAHGGNAALALIADFHPDVVVLDHRMPPGPPGLTVARTLRSTHPHLRLVLHTNYQDVDLMRQAADLGVPLVAKGNLATLRAEVERRR